MRATRVYLIGSGAVTPRRAALNCQKQPGPSPTGSCDGNARSETQPFWCPSDPITAPGSGVALGVRLAKQPVCPAGCGIDRIGAASGVGVGVARINPNRSGNRDRLPGAVQQMPEGLIMVGTQIEHADCAIAVIAHQQIAGVGAEALAGAIASPHGVLSVPCNSIRWIRCPWRSNSSRRSRRHVLHQTCCRASGRPAERSATEQPLEHPARRQHLVPVSTCALNGAKSEDPCGSVMVFICLKLASNTSTLPWLKFAAYSIGTSPVPVSPDPCTLRPVW